MGPLPSPPNIEPELVAGSISPQVLQVGLECGSDHSDSYTPTECRDGLSRSPEAVVWLGCGQALAQSPGTGSTNLAREEVARAWTKLELPFGAEQEAKEAQASVWTPFLDPEK